MFGYCDFPLVAELDCRWYFDNSSSRTYPIGHTKHLVIEETWTCCFCNKPFSVPGKEGIILGKAGLRNAVLRHYELHEVGFY